jgi:CheY-like chemotaxis protein
MQSANARILCFDDNDSRNLPVFLLEQANYEVETTQSFDEGLELLKNGKFDLIVVNSRLWQTSPNSICDKFTKNQTDIPILFYSLPSAPYQDNRPIDCGTSSTLIEPVELSNLVQSVSKLIGTKRMGVGKG